MRSLEKFQGKSTSRFAALKARRQGSRKRSPQGCALQPGHRPAFPPGLPEPSLSPNRDPCVQAPTQKRSERAPGGAANGPGFPPGQGQPPGADQAAKQRAMELAVAAQGLVTALAIEHHLYLS